MHPSLDIDEADDGRVLFVCRSRGCSPESIVAGAGLELRDLFPESPLPLRPALPRTLVESRSFVYHTLDGQPWYREWRRKYDDGTKGCPLERYEDGRWVNGLNGRRRVLYGWPQLRGKKKVTVVEGPPKVEALRALGYTATTSGGCKTWTTDHAAQLREVGVQSVLVMPDNDAAGEGYAAAVAKTCMDVGIKVGICRLPGLRESGDIVDWLKVPGNDKAALSALVKATAALTPEQRTALDVESPAGYEKDERNEITPHPGEVISSISFLSSPPVWPTLDARALYGLAGDLVRLVGPHTEAPDAALLVQTLAMAGNAIGRGPAFPVGNSAEVQHANLYVVIVGRTSGGRKGTSLGEVRRILTAADPEWARTRIISGLSSGEGLIHHVRDPIEVEEPVKEKGRVVDYERVRRDPGEPDKRILVVESEFGSPLRVAKRDGNTLTTTIKVAWDQGFLKIANKNSPETATGAHVSIVGHITSEELLREMTSTDLASGFANRFLFIGAERNKVLPLGGRVDPAAIEELGRRFALALAEARTRAVLRWDAAAETRWCAVYPRLSEGRPGLSGAVCGRGAPQVMRLALIFALLDADTAVRLPHLDAGLAIWDYAEQTAAQIFGQRTGNKDADYMLSAMRSRPTRFRKTEFHALFKNNKSVVEIDAGLDTLYRYGLATRTIEPSSEKGGRPTEYWEPTRYAATTASAAPSSDETGTADEPAVLPPGPLSEASTDHAERF
jgi:hypothetical protein